MKSIRAIRTLMPRLQAALDSGVGRTYYTSPAANFQSANSNGAAGVMVEFGGLVNGAIARSGSASGASMVNTAKITVPGYARSFASSSSELRRKGSSEARKDVSKIEDPFDAPTYNIPERPVTFTEGASYSVVILAGLGIAAAAGYAVLSELIFEPKEYKIFGKALERIQNDSQVRVRIGSPVTGYGQESMNRAARQRIPNRTWTDEDGNEHVEVNFYVRGPHGAGKVGAEMFKDKADKKWKFTYLIVDITAPSHVKLLLESYVPA
ncbi:Probable mitochondrial import inner membrane translocase subunit TIM21 [Striga hermonthica]|uniref:Mitochondrial import inner membrane translocase subunit Tim21 n=1 Tax=Striga hermonthica TaxID=68872 RepID=A0A9N7NJK9_STRHE|nr:Probable mitochondrial import inner membrane translocase subunit TIM21 [Striga hermonthica]